MLDVRRRPLVAAALALVYPGLGHLYLRQWLRSLLWFGLIVSAAVVMVPVPSVEPGAGIAATAGAVLTAVEEMPGQSRLLLAGMTAMQVLDAYMMALGGAGADRDTGSCPNCGKALDDDLAFCPWCSRDFGGAAEPE